MKKMTCFVMALALVLGFTQCKKEQHLEPENEVNTVNITLNVGGNGGSRHTIDTENGDVAFDDDDVIYVGNGSTYIGTLTRASAVFSGNINEPADGTEIYFYFVGGLPTTPADLSGQSSFTVDISDQSTQMPVLSCNHVTYRSSTSSYSCVLQNQCALVKFTTASTTDPVHVGGLYTVARIDFANNTITNSGTTGFVALNSESTTEKWAVLLPQTSFSGIEGIVADKGYTISMQSGTTIAADGFITGEHALGITSTPSHNRYLQWATGDLTLEDGDHVYGTLGGNYKVSIADGATTNGVTLDGVTINGVDEDAYAWAGINCLGDANIILSGTNTVKGFLRTHSGIYVPQNKTLTISGSGSLNASSNGYGAGIGSGYIGGEFNGGNSGNIVINGGTITATGGAYCAGIGSGFNSSCGTITINNGSVTAIGGEWAAGIGTGWGYNTDSSTCGNITINNGNVTATGGQGGAGIGAGHANYGTSTCGVITIEGGEVTANGGKWAAGIGSGLAYAGSAHSQCGNISISGGTVTATGGSNGTYPNTSYGFPGGASIGTGFCHTDAYSTCGSITITTGVTKVTASKGTGATDSIGNCTNESCLGGITIGNTAYYTYGQWTGGAYQNDGATYLAQSPLVYQP